MNPDIEINIEQLVLHGFPPGSKSQIGDSIREQLAMMLKTHGETSLLSQAGDVPFVDGGTFGASPAASPNIIGTEVARSVYSGLKKG